MKIDPKKIDLVKERLHPLRARGEDWRAVSNGSMLPVVYKDDNLKVIIYDTGTFVVQPRNEDFEAEQLIGMLADMSALIPPKLFLHSRRRSDSIFDRIKGLYPAAPSFAATADTEKRTDVEELLRNSCYLASDEALSGNLFGSTIVTAVYVNLNDSKADRLKNYFRKDPQHGSRKYAPKYIDQNDTNEHLEVLNCAIQDNILHFSTICFDNDSCHCSATSFDISGFNVACHRTKHRAKPKADKPKNRLLAAMHFATVWHLADQLKSSKVALPPDWILNAFEESSPNNVDKVEADKTAWVFFAGSSPIKFPKLNIHDLGGEDGARKKGGATCVGVNIAAWISGFFECHHISRCIAAISLPVPSLVLDVSNHDSWSQIKKKNDPSDRALQMGEAMVKTCNAIKVMKAQGPFAEKIMSAAAKAGVEPSYTHYSKLPTSAGFGTKGICGDSHELSQIIAK